MHEDYILPTHPGALNRTIYKQIEEAIQDPERMEEAKSLLLSLHYADAAHLLAIASPEMRKTSVSLLRDHFTPELLLAIDQGVSSEVIELLGVAETADILYKMEESDAVYVLEALPQEMQERLMACLPEVYRTPIADQLAYPENSAGRLMHRRVVSVMAYWTVGQVIDYLRFNHALHHDFYEIFVLNSKYQPVGAVQASRILCAPRDIPITEIMNEDFKVVQAELDQEEVSYLFTEYALSSAPVVNKDGRLVGSISVDEVLEVIGEEAEEDILRLGGVGETDIHNSFYKTASRRLPWLILNLCMAGLTCLVIHMFEKAIDKMVVLAAIMPIVASLGGNAGTQSLTVAVRSLATKELSNVNSRRVLLKEIMASFLNGLCCALVGATIVYLWQKDAALSAVFALAIIINFITAGLMGSAIPMLMSRWGVDPAIASGVLLTAITDTVGFFTFLMLASLLLL